MTRNTLVMVALALFGCGSEAEMLPGGGGGSGGTGGASGPAPSAAFVGVYQATFNAMSTFTAPPGTPAASYTDTATITVTAKSADTILMVWQVGNNPSSGTIEFKVSGAGSANGVGGTPWMGRLSNGAQQTSWCDVCGASIAGDKLTQTQQGHFEGVAANGVPYAGNYSGTWTGTRTH
jgi:hypothetical protein